MSSQGNCDPRSQQRSLWRPTENDDAPLLTYPNVPRRTAPTDASEISNKLAQPSAAAELPTAKTRANSAPTCAVAGAGVACGRATELDATSPVPSRSRSNDLSSWPKPEQHRGREGFSTATILTARAGDGTRLTVAGGFLWSRVARARLTDEAGNRRRLRYLDVGGAAFCSGLRVLGGVQVPGRSQPSTPRLLSGPDPRGSHFGD